MEMKYVISCGCGFKRVSDGSEAATSDLREVKLCVKCSGPRTFKCPGCGFVVRAKRWVEPPNPKTHVFARD